MIVNIDGEGLEAPKQLFRKKWEEEGKTESLQSFPTALISVLAFSLGITDNFANCLSATTQSKST